ncbi:MAG: heparinase II/III family protein, partial [Thermoanaerobaculia bacterium]|nr:heparinase II/III family protein [Thermoanaerobaculia bacterium]
MEIGAYLRVFREEPGPVPPAKVVRRLVAHRLRRRLRRAARRRQLRRGPIDLSEHRLLEETGRRDRDELLEHLRRRGSPRFFFEPAEMEALVAALRVDRPGSVQAAIGAADDVRAHVFDLLGSGRVELGGRIDWHRDLVTGHRWPLVPAFDVPREGAPAGTEIKRAWELSRCQHFVTLGRAYAFSRDESYAREFVQQLRSWIEENPPWIGVNWCTAMEVAIRAVNWIWAWHFFAEASAFGAEDRTLLLRSLVLHGEYLAENLEYFGPFSGNHYLADLVGLLAVATWLPELRRAKGWRRVARRRLEEEMAGQVLDDGVHFEGATSYHRLALEMFLFADLLCRRNGPSLSAAYRSRLEKMFEYVLHYTRPDGSAPQIGDNDDGRLLILGTSPPSDHRYLLSIAAALFARPDFKAAAGEFHEDALWLLGLEGRRAFAAVEPAG